MKRKSLSITIAAAASAAVSVFAPAAPAETIVQDGSLSGPAGPPQSYDIVLDRFDSMGGTRRLNFVQMDLLTSTIGGGTTNGSGIPVDIDVVLSADYYLGDDLLAATAAVIDTTIPNTGPPVSFSVFNTDTEQVIIEPPVDTAAWVGGGTVTLTGIVEFTISENPPGQLGFGAGGSVHYTVTYDYDPVALPGDVDGDGLVNVVDLVALLLAWGPCAPPDCPADVDGNGVVNVTDLVLLILNWS